MSRLLGVIGAGTMGAGIAQVSALAGFQVVLCDAAPAAAERALQQIRSNLDAAAAKGRLTPEAVSAASGRIHATTSLQECVAAEAVIEAVFEDLDLKRSIFAELDALTAPSTLLATNASSLSVTAIAEGLRHPGRLVGLHFFNPVPRMALVEVVQGRASSSASVQQATALAKELGKTPVRAKDTPGFIVNRVARPYYLEALRLLSDGGSTVEQIDQVMREGGGFPMGPFQLMDLIGIDVNLAVSESVYRAFHEAPRFEPHPIQREMAATGRLGRKTGRGFYEYQ